MTHPTRRRVIAALGGLTSGCLSTGAPSPTDRLDRSARRIRRLERRVNRSENASGNLSRAIALERSRLTALERNVSGNVSNETRYRHRIDGLLQRLEDLEDRLRPPSYWPVGRHDAWNTASTASPGPRSVPSVVWRNQLSDEYLSKHETPHAEYGDWYGPWRRVLTPAVVSHGTVYAVTARGPTRSPRPTLEGNIGLVAVDLASGKQRWRSGLPRISRTQPAVADDIVVTADLRGQLVAHDQASGDSRWTAWAGSQITAPITATRNHLYLSQREERLLRYAAESGEELWETRLAGRPSTSPVVAGEAVVVGDEAGTVTGVDAESGEERWSRRFHNRVDALAATDDQVFAFRDVVVRTERKRLGVVAAFDLTDGRERWRTSFPGGEYNSLAVTDNAVLVAGRKGVVAVRQRDGERLWRTALKDGVWDVTVSVGGESAYLGAVGDESGVIALDLAERERRWHWEGPWIRSEVVPVGETLIVAPPEASSIFRIG